MARNVELINDVIAESPTRPRAVRQSVTNTAGVLGERTAAETEVIRLVQRLFLSAATEEQPKVVAFSGVDRHAGCSWVCAKVAELLAALTQRLVCIVDANLLFPSLHEYFRVEPSPGLAEAMKQAQQIEQYVARTPTNRLWVMPAGSRKEAPIGFINPSRLRTRLAELREEFDFVLVDAPALSVSTDAVVLGSLAEGVVLVIASSATRRDAARTAKQVLEHSKIPVLGAVLNKRTYPIPAAVYRWL